MVEGNGDGGVAEVVVEGSIGEDLLEDEARLRIVVARSAEAAEVVGFIPAGRIIWGYCEINIEL